VRYFIVPAALMLTACALPGASGMGGFMTAMHPTQEVCASRGLTLDATSKQCVTPPASQGAETTGSLPSQTVTTEQPSSPPVQQAPPQPKAQQPRPQQSQPQQAQPQQAPAQPQQPQPQENRAGLSVRIEQDAVIRPDSPQNSETAAEFAHFVRASGYRCDSISALTPRPGGFTLACNRSTFRYAIKDMDGRWIVTIE
jgi:outer membrane biosynthesis protein TonB